MASVERAALEREADRLGVPWDTKTQDGQLQAGIDAKALGVDLTVYDSVPECFGQFWDKPREEVCQACPAGDACFLIFVKLIERMMSDIPGDMELAEELEVSPASIQLAKAKIVEDAAQQLEAPPVLEPEVIPPAPPEMRDATASMVQQQEAAAAGIPPEELSPAAAEKPKRKRRPPGKKKSPPGPKESPNPPIAQSAVPAAALGKMENRCADPVKESDVQQGKKRQPWGRQTWKARRERERAKSKWIAMLTPGMKLHREYQGVVHQVLVRSDSYLYLQEGVAYPTLYSVTKRIVGTKVGNNGRELCPWSAVRFWNLKRLLTSLPS